MKATAWEFRFRVIIITAFYFLGFYAPWARLSSNGGTAPPRLWSWLAIELSRAATLPINIDYLAVTALAILDLGYGNTRSVALAFERLGAAPVLTDSAAEAKAADRLVLPGVGAAASAMRRMRESA